MRSRAAEFARQWADAHYEKGDTQTFYNEFFEVFGVQRRKVATFEEPVRLLGEKRGHSSRWSMADMFAMFPRLQERQHTAAGVLSGGEQQMLTLCRTLMGDPDLIMIDEPTEGLAPKIVDLVAQYLQALKERGVSVLLVEQKLAIALDISQRVYVMGRGSIVFEGTPQQLKENPAIRKEWVEV